MALRIACWLLDVGLFHRGRLLGRLGDDGGGLGGDGPGFGRTLGGQLLVRMSSGLCSGDRGIGGEFGDLGFGGLAQLRLVGDGLELHGDDGHLRDDLLGDVLEGLGAGLLVALGMIGISSRVAALLAVSVTADLVSIAETSRRCGWKNQLPLERFARFRGAYTLYICASAYAVAAIWLFPEGLHGSPISIV